MRLRTAAFVALVGFACGVGPIVAQSLADVARKEADRRKSIKDGGKAYTNKDLPNLPAPGPSAAGSSSREPNAEKAATSRPRVTPSTEPAQETVGPGSTRRQDLGDKKESPKPMDQAAWGKQMKDLRDHLDRDQTYVDALQSRVNALTTDFVARDDPAQRAQLGLDRQKALTELDRLKKQIGDDKRAIADLEEDARRSGVPPGWLR